MKKITLNNKEYTIREIKPHYSIVSIFDGKIQITIQVKDEKDYQKFEQILKKLGEIYASDKQKNYDV